MSGSRELTLEELADSAGMTARNARAYQARGLLQPPHRDGRNASYGPEHVARLRLVRALHRRGLSLKVIRDLIDRGDAEAELAKMSRDHLLAPRSQSGMTPMYPGNVAAVQESAPGLLERLIDAGLVVQEGDRYLASSEGLGLTSALLARGVELESSSEVALLAAEAADGVVERLAVLLESFAVPEDDVPDLAIQLAASAFSDVLARRLDLP